MLSCSETEDEESPYSSSRAAQLAARLRATAQRFLRNMGRILAVTLLALAGKRISRFKHKVGQYKQ